MSIGMGAWAHLSLQDDKSVVYEYGGYNLNNPDFRNENRICDGNIFIDKNCFAEPEICEKLNRMPSGRKKTVVKRVHVDVDYPSMIQDGMIKINNCSNCWQTASEEKRIDVMVLHLLYKIFQDYQDESVIPQDISLHI